MRITNLIFIVFLGVQNIQCTYAGEVFPELDGKWKTEMNSKDIGNVRTVFYFDTRDSTFTAHTRKGAAGDILGFWKSALARIFTSDFKKGSLLHVTDGKISVRNDTLVLTGIFRSAIGSYHFNGKAADDQLTAVLTDARGKKKGQLTAEHVTDVQMPPDDYPEIVKEALAVAKDKIYNPKITDSDAWKDFESQLTEKAPEFRDDVELVFAFFYYARELPVSHFALTRIADKGQNSEPTKPEKHLSLKALSPETALLEVESFEGSAREVDSVFAEIMKNDFQNLIVDLRGNPGGTVEAGMAFARHVADTAMTGGVFLTQKWFRANEHIPQPDEYDQFPYFSEANYDLIISGIHKEKGLVLKIIPEENHFKGALYLVTDGATASTCEPLVYGLQNNTGALIVGSRTAGSMLNGERFEISNGFSVFVPTADYYTSDGFRIDQNGVEPDIKLSDEDPVKYIREELIQ